MKMVSLNMVAHSKFYVFLILKLALVITKKIKKYAVFIGKNWYEIKDIAQKKFYLSI